MPESLARLWRTLTRAIALVTTTFGIGLLVFEASDILRTETLSLETVFKLALLLCVGLLILQWLIIPRQELKLLTRWVGEPKGGFEVHPVLIYADALLLLALIFACRNPLWFGVAYFVYNGANLLGAIYSKDIIKCALCKREQETTADKEKKAIRYLQAHYVDKPNIPRITAMTVLGLVGLAIAVYGKFYGVSFLRSVAYILYAVSLAVFESIIFFFWRLPLYGNLSHLAALKEHHRVQV